MRPRSSAARLALAPLAVLLALSASVAAIGAARAADVSEVEALIREGVELRMHGKDERALPLFQRAYALSPTPRTAGQLGLAEMAVGYWLDAERHLGAALDSADHPWVAKNRGTLEGALARVRTNIGAVKVTGSPRGATVTINKERAGTLPLPGPVRVVKGKAEVEVRAPGYTLAVASVRVTGDGVQEVNIALEKAAAAAAGPDQDGAQPGSPTTTSEPPSAGPTPAAHRSAIDTNPPPADSDVRATAGDGSAPDRARTGGEVGGRSVAGVVLGGVAVAALATGIIAHVAREQRAKDFNAGGCRASGDQVVGPAGCRGVFNDIQLTGTLAIAGYSATALLGGLSLYLLLTGHPDRAASSPSSSVARARTITCAPTLGAALGTACVVRF